MKQLKSFYLFVGLCLFSYSSQAQKQTKTEVDPQAIVDTIEGITSVVNSANNLIDQLIPDENSIGTDQQLVDFIAPEELIKWKYIYQYFSTRMNNLNTTQKVAKFVNDYAKYLAAPAIAIYVATTSSLFEQLKSLLTTKTESSEQETIISKAVNTSVDLGSGSVKYIASPIVICLLTYKIIKFVSSKIEQNAETCNAALIEFAANWPQHKAYTPEVLCNFFEHLNIELTNNNGKLPKVDALIAQKIVEAIVTSASLYNSI